MFEKVLLEAVKNNDIDTLIMLAIKLTENNQLKELVYNYEQHNNKSLFTISLQKSDLTIATLIFNNIAKIDTKFLNLSYGFNFALADVINSELNDVDTEVEINRILDNFPLEQADKKNIVNYTDNNQRYISLLYLAVEKNKKKVVLLLINLGANVDLGKLNNHYDLNNTLDLEQGTNLESPLCLAASNGNVEILTILINNGANIFFETWSCFQKNTPFFTALINEKYECAEKLLQSGVGLHYNFCKKEQKFLKKINLANKIVIGFNFVPFSKTNTADLRGWGESINTIPKLEDALKNGIIEHQKCDLLPFINSCNHLLNKNMGNLKDIKKIRDICSRYIGDSLLDKCRFRIAFGTDADFFAIRQQLLGSSKVGIRGRIINYVSSFFKEQKSNVKPIQAEIPESLKAEIIEVQKTFNPSHYL